MGLDVHLTPKNRDYDYSIEDRLSRRFCNFLCGFYTFPNSEFGQVQQILEIDLDVFLKHPVNFEPKIDELEYQIYLAEENNDLEKISALKEKIEQERIEWDKNYEIINEGWTLITELESLASRFRAKLIENPALHKQLKYNFDWGDYFYLERIPMPKNERLSQEIEESINHVRNILIEDLQSVLNWIESAKKMNIKYVTFDYG